MQKFSWKKPVWIAVIALILITLPVLSACGGDADTTTDTGNGTNNPTVTEETKSEFEVVQEAVAEYLLDKAGNIQATDLYLRIAEDDAPYIVSLRTAEDFAKGHIPGAVYVKFSDLSTLPDEEILVYCHTGQSASMAAAILGVLDYDVQNLKHGMSSWTKDASVYVKRFEAANNQRDFNVETTTNAATKTYDYPTLNNTTSTNTDDIIDAAVATVTTRYIMATDLNIKIAEDEDMTILSVRSAADYAAGHIPGAINIELGDLADNLDKLDPDNPVYVYCHTGHSAAQATALLNLLGYDAYSLKYGMCSWTPDTSVNMSKCFDDSAAQDYETEK